MSMIQSDHFSKGLLMLLNENCFRLAQREGDWRRTEVVTHNAYHRKEIRQALCTLKLSLD